MLLEVTTNYIIGGVRGFTFTEYLATMKAQCKEWAVYLRLFGDHYEQDPNKELIEQLCDVVEPLTVSQAFKEQNLEKRRVLFSALGPAKIFEQVRPDLIDRQVIKL